MPFAAVFDPQESFAERKRQLMDRAGHSMKLCDTAPHLKEKRPTEI
jgi:hypothetical protein